MVNSITPQQFEPAFDIAKAMREGRLDTSQALERMVENGFSHSSATMYLNALMAMPVGKVYQKTINNPAARYYLQRFMSEMTATEFATVLLSVTRHIHYYNAQGAGKHRQLATILAEFQSLAKVHYSQNFNPTLLPSEISEAETGFVFHEGAMKTIELSVHEREPAARRACIEHYSVSCHVCGFDFEHAYGDIGKGFIHVHHRVDLALVSNRREVNPIEDLIPVCPNCHAMLHTETPAMAVDKLKELLKQNLQG